MIKRKLTEDQFILLESLVRSPVLGALTALLENYKVECYAVLRTSKEMPKIFETQGRLIGMNVVTELPKLIIQQRENQKKAQVIKNEAEERIAARKKALRHGRPQK